MANRSANENSPTIRTLDELAPLADYSLMDTLNRDPYANEERLLTTRWRLRGSGDTVSTYSGANARSFIHKRPQLH